ncbi:helix-turn-helix transcriptional regulator [Streptomyces sp. NPDC057430]|uniref:helix-turn-helix transcriptional regulator n=1 Tax=Streptomyces sp. NPDC057430 TaxID=3346131 RepID=UPI00368F4C85
MPTELLSAKQVAAEYGFSEQALRNWRCAGTGPAFIKLSPGKGGRIRYQRSAIETWLNARTVRAGGAA